MQLQYEVFCGGRKSPGLTWARHRALLVQSWILCLVSTKAQAQPWAAAAKKAGQALGTCRKWTKVSEPGRGSITNPVLLPPKASGHIWRWMLGWMWNPSNPHNLASSFSHAVTSVHIQTQRHRHSLSLSTPSKMRKRANNMKRRRYTFLQG